MLLQVDENFSPDPVPEPPDLTQANSEDPQMELHLSLNALKGANGVDTIKFIGHIGEISVQILLDGGNSNNFLHPKLAHFLHLPIEPAPFFKVLVGNGNTLAAEGLVKHLTVKVQDHELHLPVYLVPVAKEDLILVLLG